MNLFTPPESGVVTRHRIDDDAFGDAQGFPVNILVTEGDSPRTMAGKVAAFFTARPNRWIVVSEYLYRPADADRLDGAA
jgi:hypothetical protein